MPMITLTQGKQTEVDDATFQWAQHWKWHYGSKGYAITALYQNNKRYVIRLHRLVHQPILGMEIDHIDGDTLNNTASNLRYATHRENGQNMSCHRQGKTVGVRFVDGKWQAQYTKKKKAYFIGRYGTKEEAIEAHRKTMEKLKRKEVSLR